VRVPAAAAGAKEPARSAGARTLGGVNAAARTCAAVAPPASAGDKALYDFLAPPQAADELGRLGPYRVLEVLGAGGMGVVFRAEDPQLARLVALKAMLPVLAASDGARQRFLREARGGSDPA
jgi:serine/threonine protein kinase